MLSIVVCKDKNSGIGLDNNLLVKIKEDMQFFCRLTRSEDSVPKDKWNKVIMGRKTFESLPNGALDNRINIILTKDTGLQSHDNIVYVNDIKELIKYESVDEEVFVIGGEQIYDLLLPYCTRIHLTVIERRFKANKYFSYNPIEWYISYESVPKVSHSNFYPDYCGEESRDSLTFIFRTLSRRSFRV